MNKINEKELEVYLAGAWRGFKDGFMLATVMFLVMVMMAWAWVRWV